MKNVQKRYIFLGIVIVGVVALIWRLSTSYASVNQGYEGRNIVSGNRWGINILEVGSIEKNGDAELIGDISTIGTTLNFNAILFHPGDKVSFNITVGNTSTLNAELYALTLSGLSKSDSEYINYSILPIDSSLVHTSDTDGSIIKSGEKQVFNIVLEYDSNAKDQNKEYNLSLGSTIIYKQR